MLGKLLRLGLLQRDDDFFDTVDFRQEPGDFRIAVHAATELALHGSKVVEAERFQLRVCSEDGVQELADFAGSRSFGHGSSLRLASRFGRGRSRGREAEHRPGWLAET